MCFGKDKNINYLNSELDKAPLYRPEIEALKIEISNEFDVALSDFQSKLHAGKVVCQTEEELLASHNSHAADHSEL